MQKSESLASFVAKYVTGNQLSCTCLTVKRETEQSLGQE